MANKKVAKKYEVLKTVRHDGERRERGSIIEIDHEFTAKTLEARGYIRPANGKKPTDTAENVEDSTGDDENTNGDPGTPENPVTPDPAMAPAQIKENDSGSEKVDTSDAQ